MLSLSSKSLYRSFFILQNLQKANLTTEEVKDVRGVENAIELSSEEMRVEDNTNKVNEQELTTLAD